MRRFLVLLLAAALATGCVGVAESAEHEGPVVFLGDSITERQPWSASFPDLDLRNEGRNGNTSEDVLGRLRDTIAHEPRAVFLLVGANDLYFEVPVAETRRNVDRILGRLAERVPDADVYVQTVLPREPRYDDHLARLNPVLQALAAEHGATWIDLWPAMTRDGRLRDGYHDDGVHLSPRGQEAWADVLRPHVEP